jgi:hypothetical protein
LAAPDSADAAARPPTWGRMASTHMAQGDVMYRRGRKTFDLAS